MNYGHKSYRNMRIMTPIVERLVRMITHTVSVYRHTPLTFTLCAATWKCLHLASNIKSNQNIDSSHQVLVHTHKHTHTDNRFVYIHCFWADKGWHTGFCECSHWLEPFRPKIPIYEYRCLRYASSSFIHRSLCQPHFLLWTARIDVSAYDVNEVVYGRAFLGIQFHTINI